MISILKKRLGEDEGVTLVEILVTFSLFAILGTMLMSTVLTSARTLEGAKQSTDLNEQARLVLNRMSRELREASRITGVSNPGGSTHDPTATSTVSFEVDFNGNGAFEPSAADAEWVTYTYSAPSKRIFLQTPATTVPILSDNVENFKLFYNSRFFQCDFNRDGTVTWEEIDDAPFTDCPDELGNDDNLLNTELSSINMIVIEITVLTGTRKQEYRTQVDLRNRGG